MILSTPCIYTLINCLTNRIMLLLPEAHFEKTALTVILYYFGQFINHSHDIGY